MRLGVCYYPEHWPESIWTFDAKEMAALGIEIVRLGEFSWSRIESRRNHFSWEWLDRAIDVLADQGLKLVLGTPTACPPKWLVDEFPDILATDEFGHARRESIDQLNESWGNVFWSQEYGCFDEIDPPVGTVTEANPSHRLDYRRFASDEVVSFNRLQVEIIREHAPRADIGLFLDRQMVTSCH